MTASAEVILTRLGLLANAARITSKRALKAEDEEADLLPHFQRVFPVLLDLIGAAGKTGQQDADLLEHAKECLTYLLRPGALLGTSAKCRGPIAPSTSLRSWRAI